MRNLQPGNDVFHLPTNIPGKIVRVVGDVVTVEMFDPAGTGKRIQKAYPADEVEPYDERRARKDHDAEENNPRPKPPRKPLYDV